MRPRHAIRIGRRPGTIYITVLATVTIVALLGTAGVLAQTRRRERARSTQDAPKAAAMARAALDIGLERIAADADWRTNIGGGVWYEQAALTGEPKDGVFTLLVTAPDGTALGTDAADGYKLTAIGVRGTAQRTVSVTARSVPGVNPMDCLEVSVLAGEDIRAATSSTLTGTGTIAANANIVSNLAQVVVDAEASGTVSGMVYHGSTTNGVGVRTIPPINDLGTFVYAAEHIQYHELEKSGGEYILRAAALGPGHNPIGSGRANDDGYYLINCGNRDVVIEDCRVVGTLILTNPGSGSVIRSSVSLQPATEGYPALIVHNGSISFQMSNAPLSEASLSTNFNPTGVPDAFGDQDSDTLDEYDSKIEGIVYVEQNAAFLMGGVNTVQGHLVVGNRVELEATSILVLQAWDEALSSPPPGFQVSGSSSELVMGPIVRELD